MPTLSSICLFLHGRHQTEHKENLKHDFHFNVSIVSVVGWMQGFVACRNTASMKTCTKNNWRFFLSVEKKKEKKRNIPQATLHQEDQGNPQFGTMLGRGQHVTGHEWRHQSPKENGWRETRSSRVPFTGISGGTSSWFSLLLFFLYLLSFLGRAGDTLTKLVTVSPELNPEQIIRGSVQLAASAWLFFLNKHHYYSNLTCSVDF